MKFTHRIPTPCRLIGGSSSSVEMMATLVCKLTCRVDAQGNPTPVALDEAWPILDEPADLLGVNLGVDADFRQRDADVIVIGPAVAPGNKPTRAMKVGISCGGINWQAAVFGDRTWVQDEAGVRASEATEFVTMPLTPERAFGGPSIMAGEPIAYTLNTVGRGYIAPTAKPAGVKLPNVERLDQPVRKPTDEVTPICPIKLPGPAFEASGPNSLAELGKPENVARLVERMMRSASQSAPLELTCPSDQLGSELVMSGFDALGDLRWKLPPSRAIFPAPVGQAWGPVAHANVGGKRSAFPLAITRLVALPVQRVLCITYVGSFRYLFVAEQIRTCELLWHGRWTLDPLADHAETAAIDARGPAGMGARASSPARAARLGATP